MNKRIEFGVYRRQRFSLPADVFISRHCTDEQTAGNPKLDPASGC